MLRGDLRVDGIARLSRTLTAYALHDCQVGYCQGMADLAVPFLDLYADDEQAFAVFSAFMARVRRNFLPGMRAIQHQMQLLGDALSRVDHQLHRHLLGVGAGSYVFAFQMLLLQLRRELTLPDTFTLWECMWASEALLTAARREQHHQQQRRLHASWGIRWRPLSGAAAAREAAAAANQQREAETAAASAASSGSAAAPVEDGLPPQRPCTVVAPAGDAEEPNDERVDLRVYVVAAALRAQRKALLGCRSMEEVVQFVNRFPPPTDVVALVRDGERIYRARERGGGGATAAGSVGPMRIFSGCLCPPQQQFPVTADSQAWSATPRGAVA